jgi:demethylmenaquinone methyltransferase/2-methoxy-6-polyprenyl-1,4-benzoquinol methylase
MAVDEERLKEQAYIQALEETFALRVDILGEIIAQLNLPRGSWGLDAGCGIGLITELLAREIGPQGLVVGLDNTPAFLEFARAKTKGTPLADGTAFQKGNVNHPPFDQDAFDWVWSCDCIGYPADDPQKQLMALAKVVRPGGQVAIVAWSSQQILPGYPALEARLNATHSGVAPFSAATKPQNHYARGMGWFQGAGLIKISARTYVANCTAPLSPPIRQGLLALLKMRWNPAPGELSKEEQALFQALVDPDSPQFILDCADYHGFFTYTLVRGQKP